MALERSLLYRVDYLHDTVTEGWAAARHVAFYLTVMAELWLMVGHVYGWRALTTTQMRHKPRHGGVGTRRPFKPRNKAVYSRRGNSYTVAQVLRVARHRFTPKEDTWITHPMTDDEKTEFREKHAVGTIVQPRDEKVDDAGFASVEGSRWDTGDTWRSWREYELDLIARGVTIGTPHTHGKEPIAL